MLAKCKNDPKAMFDKICKKYGSEEDTDLSDLLDDFNECVLNSKNRDPEDWYAELEQINEQTFNKFLHVNYEPNVEHPRMLITFTWAEPDEFYPSPPRNLST